MTKWNKEQKQLFEYLINYVTDNATAGIIVNGGENGYYYGRGGYVSIDRDDKELMEQEGLLIDDAGLDGTYLVGSHREPQGATGADGSRWEPMGATGSNWSRWEPQGATGADGSHREPQGATGADGSRWEPMGATGADGSHREPQGATGSNWSRWEQLEPMGATLGVDKLQQ